MVKVRDPEVEAREMATSVGRLEADRVRFASTRVDGGGYRHEPCKYVFEVRRRKTIFRD